MSRRIKNLLFCCVAIVAFSRPGVARATPWSLDAVLTQAKSQTPEQRILAAERDAALAAVTSYRALALPDLDFEVKTQRFSYALADFPEAEQDSVWGLQHQAALTFRSPLYTFGRTRAVSRIADLQEKHAKVSYAEKRYKYMLRILRAYAEALRAENHVASARFLVEHRNSLADFTELEEAHGGRSKVDLLRAQAAQKQAQAVLERALVRANAARDALGSLIGLKTPIALDTSPDTLEKNRFFHTELPRERQSLHLEGLSVAHELQEQWVRYRRRDFLPRLSLFASANTDARSAFPGAIGGTEDPQIGDAFDAKRVNYALGLALTWNFFDGFATRAELHKAVSERTAARERLELGRRDEALRRSLADGRLRAARRIVEAMRQASEAMDLALVQAEEDLRHDSLSVADLLELQGESADLRDQVFAAYEEEILALAEFRMAYRLPITGGEE